MDELDLSPERVDSASPDELTEMKQKAAAMMRRRLSCVSQRRFLGQKQQLGRDDSQGLEAGKRTHGRRGVVRWMIDTWYRGDDEMTHVRLAAAAVPWLLRRGLGIPTSLSLPGGRDDCGWADGWRPRISLLRGDATTLECSVS